ncbi:MAG: YqgE/AlgH family protein, partial [Pseudomonadota bacterium]
GPGWRGFVLHSPEYNTREATLDVGDDFAMTATLDILEDMAKGEGPNRAILALGYAGWGPGQLEGEIMRNGWLTCDASQQLVFDIPNNQKWAAAIESLGIHIHALSGDAGRA